MMTKEVENLVGSLEQSWVWRSRRKVRRDVGLFLPIRPEPEQLGLQRTNPKAPRPKSIKGNLFTVLVGLTEKPSLCYGMMTCIPYHACYIQSNSLILPKEKVIPAVPKSDKSANWHQVGRKPNLKPSCNPLVSDILFPPRQCRESIMLKKWFSFFFASFVFPMRESAFVHIK